MDEIEKRKENLLKLFGQYKNYIIYVVLAGLAWFAFKIRTSNLPILNGHLSDPDAHLFYRYAEYILEHGKLFVMDHLRYYPIGYNTGGENIFLSYFIVWLYKLLHIFNSTLTLKQVDIMYPAIVFIPGLIFFYLLVKRLFDWRVGLTASALLVVLPAYLFRTMSGVSDKEGLSVPIFFMLLYFYVIAWQSKSMKGVVLFGTLAGISTVLLGLGWGGVQFIFLIIGLFNLIELFLNKFEKKDFVIYTLWYLITVIGLVLLTPMRYSFSAFFTSPVLAVPSFVFLIVVVDYLITNYNLFNLKHRFEKKIPYRVVSVISAVILGFIFIILIHGPAYLFEILKNISTNMLAPFGETRWALTVAESRQPYFINWLSDFGWFYFVFFITSSILLFYELIKPIKKRKYHLTVLFAFMVLSLIFSRYSSDSILNGTNDLSKFLYFGSIILFIIGLAYFYFSAYRNDKDLFKNMMEIDKRNTFLLIWLFVMLIAARGAIRLIFVLAPITVILVSHFFFYVIDYAKSLKVQSYKWIAYLVIVILFVFIFSGFAQSTMTQAKHIGPIYNYQWQMAESWVKENTDSEDIFLHWWDYGYLVQTGFNRATVTDGGNSVGVWNHYVGRHVLTGQNEDEGLEFMKSHNVSYLLAVSEDIGKYSAYSSIGSDENYDRFSWIPVFGVDLSQTQETRDSTVYLYTGGFPFDEDFIYNDEIFPRGGAGIAGFMVPIQVKGDYYNFGQPVAIVVKGDKRYDFPISCVAYGENVYNFNNAVIDGCLKILPFMQSQTEVMPVGASVYLSPKVKRTLFSQLYVLGQEFNNIKLAYQTEGMSLVVYQGRLIGPMKIWEITYPDYIKVNQTYIDLDWPNPEVMIPKAF